MNALKGFKGNTRDPVYWLANALAERRWLLQATKLSKRSRFQRLGGDGLRSMNGTEIVFLPQTIIMKHVLSVVSIFILAPPLFAQLLPQSESTSGRRRIVAPGYYSPIPEANKVGINSEDDFDGAVMPVPTLVANARNKGAGWVRYWVHWDKTAPHRPVNENDYRWDVIDKELINIRHAGMNIYLDISWAPAWATEDSVPGYVTWQCMGFSAGFATVWFLKDDPNCQQQKVNEMEWRGFVGSVVKRYSKPPYNVKYFGLWNEPNFDIFWHRHDDTFSKTIDEDWPKSPNLTIVEEILVPGIEAIRAANPSAVVVGPEAADPLFLKWVLQEEQKYGRLFDIVLLC